MRALWVLPLLWLGCGPSNTLKLSSSGATVDLTLEPFSFTVRGTDGRAVLTSLKGSDAYGDFAETTDLPSFVNQLVPGWDGYRAHDGTWVHGGTAKLLESTKSSAKVRLTLPGGTVTATFSVDGTRVRVEHHFEPDGTARYNKSTLGFSLPADEHFFGLGERFATVDHRGWSLYSWGEEGALGGGEDAGPLGGQPVPQRAVDDVLPGAVPPLQQGLRAAPRHHLPHRGAPGLRAQRRLARRGQHHQPRLHHLRQRRPAATRSSSSLTTPAGPPCPRRGCSGPRRRISIGDTVDGGAEWAGDARAEDAGHHRRRRDALLARLVADGPRAGNSRLDLARSTPPASRSSPTTTRSSPRTRRAGRPTTPSGEDGGYFVKDPDGGPSLAFLISGAPLYVAMVDFTNPAANELVREAALAHRRRRLRRVDARLRRVRAAQRPLLRRPHAATRCTTSTRCSRRRPRATCCEAAQPDDHLFFVRAGYTGTQAVRARGVGRRRRGHLRRDAGHALAMLRGGLNLGADRRALLGQRHDGLQVHHRRAARQGGLPALARAGRRLADHAWRRTPARTRSSAHQVDAVERPGDDRRRVRATARPAHAAAAVLHGRSRAGGAPDRRCP